MNLPRLAILVFWLGLLFVVYTWFGYPLLMAAVARLRPRPLRRIHGYTPSVTAVVAMHNEARHVESRVRNLLDLAYPAHLLDLVIVSDGSTDSTPAILADLAAREPQLRPVVLDQNEGKAAALNAAVERACGEILLFADARQRFEPGALGRLVENLSDPAVGSASGELMIETGPGIAGEIGLYWRYEKWIRRTEAISGSMLGATGAIYALRRDLWRPLPRGTILDDFLAPMRAVLRGKRAVFDERAIAWDRPSTHSRQEFRRKVRTLAGNFQAFALEPALLLPFRNPAWFRVWSHKVFRLLVPYALVAIFAASLFAPGPLYAGAIVLQGLFYGFGLAGLLAERSGRAIPSRLVRLAATFIILNAAAVAGLWLWLRGGATAALWQKAYGGGPAGSSGYGS